MAEQGKRNKRALFVSLNSPGHINSLLGIADVLRGRSFETIFMTLGPLLVENVQCRGHKTVVVDDTEAYVSRNGQSYLGGNKWPIIIEECRKYFAMSPLEALVNCFELADAEMIRELKCYNSRYGEIIEQLDPDVIVVDMYFIPPCIVLGSRPWARVYSANPLGLATGDDCPPEQAGFNIPGKEVAQQQPEVWARHRQEWRQFKQQFRDRLQPLRAQWGAWYRSLGLPPLAEGKNTYDSPHLNIYMFPACIDYTDLRPYPPRWIRCDSLMRTDTMSDGHDDAAIKIAISSIRKLGQKLIYFSMGSLASGDVALMERLVAILAKSPHRFIVAKGINGNQYQLAPNMWGENFVSQTLALANADLAVTHGGNNSLTECFYFGCPMLVLPAFADQLDNAQRVADKRFGKRLNPYRPDEEAILAAIEELLADHQLSKRMKLISKEMQSRNEATKGAEMVQILATEGSLDDSTIERFKSM